MISLIPGVALEVKAETTEAVQQLEQTKENENLNEKQNPTELREDNPALHQHEEENLVWYEEQDEDSEDLDGLDVLYTEIEETSDLATIFPPKSPPPLPPRQNILRRCCQ